MADKNIIRDWEMSAKTRPDKIEDMALSPSIKSLLLNWEKGRVIKHCIMHGHSGTGKTTSARIIAPLIDKQFEEINCTTDGSKDELKVLTKKMTTTNIFQLVGQESSTKVFFLDEFHDIPISAQNVLKKFMEDYSEKAKLIICVNDMEKVSSAIADRCVFIPFDVAVINPRNGKLELLPDSGFKSVDDWKKELARSADIVAKKLDIKLTKELKDKVASNPYNLVSMRSYIRGCEMSYFGDL
mgnify:CR=1 FL=1|jgi:DNA polymerase III delta prime subunit|tara:strand:- start:596 stop:1318 length:723 start_codon:yes stop_codon:yes gene_type:complete